MRLLGLLIFGGLVYFVAEWLFAHPGEVDIRWMGYEITLHIAMLGIALLILLLVGGMVSINLWKLLTWPSRRRARKKQRVFKRGLEQLTRGVTALAMGDEDAAEESLKKALLALPGEPLPQLLTAQLLQRQGKHGDAQLQFKALMHHPATAELAARRLIEQHVSRGEYGEAIALVEDARKKSPKDRWLLLTLVDLHARAKDADAILALTEGWGWQSPLTKEERHRYAAIGHYLKAHATENLRKKEQALRHAVGFAPDFLPAMVEFAYLQMEDESPRKARKWLLTAWREKPSPLLIAPILASMAHEKPAAQQRLLKPFLKNGDTVVHHLLAARQAIAVEEFARARASLHDVLDLEENKDAMTLMATVERELIGDDAASAWMARAVNAPQSISWVCNSCGTTHEQWQPHCSHCQHFDSLRYERPETRITSVEITAHA